MNKRDNFRPAALFISIFFLLAISATARVSQSLQQDEDDSVRKSLDLQQGYITAETSLFHLKLVSGSQTVAALLPKSATSFDFTPGNILKERSANGYYHLGDINLRIREAGKEYTHFSSAKSRKNAVSIKPGENVLAAADISSTFPAEMPLRIIRSWEDDAGALILRFKIENISDKTIEIGALGVPMIFNNILTGKTLDSAHTENVFYDPYIGLDAGYLQVVRLNGAGPVLLVMPDSNASFEAYNPLNDDPTPRGITFEGFHEWMVHSKAYAEQEWDGVTPWNNPTSTIIPPGEAREFSWKFVLAESVREIESTLQDYGHPVAMGVPGYVLPMDVDARLMLDYPGRVAGIQVWPEGAVTIESINNSEKHAYALKGEKWGRARITVTYADGLKQSIACKVVKPEKEIVADFGRFLVTRQWYENESDPFNRHKSIISYDYFEGRQVTQDSRAWHAGLSDEAGAGSWLGAFMKQLILPDAAELRKIEDFYFNTLWGGIQYTEGARLYGVRKSMFYYAPDLLPAGTYADSIDYSTWAAWDKEHAESTERSFNYVHVAAAHWVMYRLSRYHQGLLENSDWKFYLENACQTALAMVDQAPVYAEFGQMEGTVFVMILKDLRREGLSDLADRFEKVMKKRADHWQTLNFPFGSEMPWDSTGQEEIYMWSQFFGLDAMANVTLNAILAYMPTVPHWGYNGSARRYWDFVYGGKLQRIERQLHHYGSGLNAIPVLAEYRKKPHDLYLLRVGYGGLLGAISNITEDGFGPAAFHSYPSTLEIDGYSGDYGSNFTGYALNTASYLVNDPADGWMGFGGNVSLADGMVTLDVTTAAASKVYVASAGLWLTLDAGRFLGVTYNESSNSVIIKLDKADENTDRAFLRIEQPAQLPGIGTFSPDEDLSLLNGAYEIELGQEPQEILIRQN